MKIKSLQLKQFKRFDDLTINLGESPKKIIALVGPNGCGKSSVFDAFEEKLKDLKSSQGDGLPITFFSKSLFSLNDSQKLPAYEKHKAVQLIFDGEIQQITKKSFHFRSAYRFTPRLLVSSISAQPSILDDTRRPASSISLDNRMKENYERMLGITYGEFDKGAKTGEEVKKEQIGKLNTVLKEILDVQISSLGNVIENKGQLFFEKSDAKNFPYENLSSGEKEVIDLILDLVVRSKEFDDTVYCIDEPELHLNTAIQRKLLVEIEKLIPENCQLWVATHSIGFLRALQTELSDKCAVIDFSEKEYFRGSHTLTPMKSTRANWQRIFSTALDDLVGLIAPRQIVYCEGRSEPDANGDEQGLDAIIYNEVFATSHPDTLFVSSGGTNDLPKNSSLALKIISKAFLDVNLLLLRDRDRMTDEQRGGFLKESPHHRMLNRHELENYLFDFEVLKRLGASNGLVLNEIDYNSVVQDIRAQDLKANDTSERLKKLVGFKGAHLDFKKSLASFLNTDCAAYADLEHCIF